jgi:hypothetical protein
LIVGSRASVYGFVVLGFLPLRFSTESFVWVCYFAVWAYLLDVVSEFFRVRFFWSVALTFERFFPVDGTFICRVCSLRIALFLNLITALIPLS